MGKVSTAAKGSMKTGKIATSMGPKGGKSPKGGKKGKMMGKDKC